MANTKKTYTKKIEDASVNDAMPEVEAETENKPTRGQKKKKTFDNSELIDCRSMIHGALYMEGRSTGQTYYWADINDIVGVEYRDLVSEVRNSSSAFIYNPRLYIDNEEFVEQFPKLKEFYEDLYDENDFMNILNMSVGDMTRAIEELPDKVKERLKSYIGFQVGNGILDSISKIRALDEIFGTNIGFVSSIDR